MALFISGAAVVTFAVATGEADVSLFLIFPVFSGSSGLFLLGVALVVLALLVGFASMVMGQPYVVEREDGSLANRSRGAEPEQRSRYGGVVLIGPIPVAFGSDKKMALAMIVVAVALAVAVLLFILLQ